MKKFFAAVIKYRKVIFLVFILAAVAGALLRPLVGVNYDMKDYLPEDTPSTRALRLMEKEFAGNMPNARVMIRAVTYKEARDYKKRILMVDGVEDVMWLDDAFPLLSMPLSMADQEDLDTYFHLYDGGKAGGARSGEAQTSGSEAGGARSGDGRSGDALMIVTIDKDKRLRAVPQIREIVGDENCMGGDAVSTVVATYSTVEEIRKIAAVSVLLVLLILILTTRSWLDPVIILSGIGVAVLINNGSNLIFGEISFVTNASTSILQLAVSLDYSVFLIHRFEECREHAGLRAGGGGAARLARERDGGENRAGLGAGGGGAARLAEGNGGCGNGAGQEAGAGGAARLAEGNGGCGNGAGQPLHGAMVEALCKSAASIASSGLTTVIGFLALTLMRFQIGQDMGLALAKGVIISLITVFTFTPAMIIMLSRWTDRARHRQLLPDFARLGGFVRRVMIPAVVVFAVAVAPAFVLSNQNEYYFGASHIFGPGTQVGDDAAQIREVFGAGDTYAIMVPQGEHGKEKALVDALKQDPQVRSIRSWDETVSALVPHEAMPRSLTGLLASDDYDRIVLSVEAEYEGEDTFRLVQRLRDACASVYGNDYYLAGEGVSTYDLMLTVTSDLLKINLAAVLAVFLVLVVMYRRVMLPLLLVASIETAIWINVAIPGLMGQNVFYIAYLIISSVQLGATVDYAILVTSRYREMRQRFDKERAVVETIRTVTASIFTSGSALVIVGSLMGALSSHGILAQLGVFISRGAVCSLLIVFFVLPGLLYVFDRWAAGCDVR